MAKSVKEHFLVELNRRFPSIRRANSSLSLFEIPENGTRIYIRYSKLHGDKRTFYGLREADLRYLQGSHALMCFLWDGQTAPLLIPFSAFEEVFSSVSPAQDGQYKVQIYPHAGSTELYVAGAGRFDVESYFGWNELNAPVDSSTQALADTLTHSQVQTLLGAIGFAKGNDVWFPQNDRLTLDWVIAEQFPLYTHLPARYDRVAPILSEIDVVWLKRGAGELVALFEVEHTTSIYSGLLRFNDVHLTAPDIRPRYSVVSHDVRRAQFARQINRPTFQASGLFDLCTFMRYENVLDWHMRLTKKSDET
jgi:hypothetical protein